MLAPTQPRGNACPQKLNGTARQGIRCPVTTRFRSAVEACCIYEDRHSMAFSLLIICSLSRRVAISSSSVLHSHLSLIYHSSPEPAYPQLHLQFPQCAPSSSPSSSPSPSHSPNPLSTSPPIPLAPLGAATTAPKAGANICNIPSVRTLKSTIRHMRAVLLAPSHEKEGLRK